VQPLAALRGTSGWWWSMRRARARRLQPMRPCAAVARRACRC